MKISLLTIIASAASVSSAAGTTSSIRGSGSSRDVQEELVAFQHDIHFKNDFKKWMKDFNKEYKSIEEYTKRMTIWIENHLFIEKHNKKTNPKPSYTLGHNHFSDLTFQEYRQYNKLGIHSPGIVTNRGEEEKESSTSVSRRRMEEENGGNIIEDDELPTNVNWVEKGGVVPVKNQGMCGSCWAFSAVGAIEGAHYVDTGSLVSLSEQQLVDCDKSDMGCSGGLMDNAFTYDETTASGICSEEDYPYAGIKHMLSGCSLKKDPDYCTGVSGTKVKRFIDIKNTEKGLMEALTKAPVSVAIEADQQSFQFYKSGVYDDENCGNKLDHGVVAVGYGTATATLYEIGDGDDDKAAPDDDGKDYFLVRNSWGPTWGDEGYIKMARTSSNPANVNGTCGILSFASRPILAKTSEEGPDELN